MDSDDSRTVKINLPPVYVSGTDHVPAQTLTFGKFIHDVPIPAYADLEGDPIEITFRDDKNPFWSIYADLVTTKELPFFTLS